MMARRAPASGIVLTASDAAVVKGMLARGDRQHDVASYFGVNSARIADIALGRAFSWVERAGDNLPTPGPYLVRRDVDALRATLDELLNALCRIEQRSNTVSR